jgi:hypothetical protein
VEWLENPVPLTVRVKDGPPANAKAGLRLEILGVGGFILNLRSLDVAPSGLRTKTWGSPGAIPEDAERNWAV